MCLVRFALGSRVDASCLITPLSVLFLLGCPKYITHHCPSPPLPLCPQGVEAVRDDLLSDVPPGTEPALSSLDLAYTGVTDLGLEHLGLRLPRLGRLVLAQPCNNNFSSGMWTEAGVATLRALTEGRVEVVFVSC